MIINNLLSPLVALMGFLCAFPLSATAAKNQEEVPLNSRGTALLERYTKQLNALRAEVVAALPAIDGAKKARFMELRTKWNEIPEVTDDTKPAEKKAIEESTERIQSELLAAGETLIADLLPVPFSDKLDPKLMRIAVLTHGTPRGFAEFAQQGADKEKLLEKLFADEALMRQVLEAGGANGGAYGPMMEVYTAILDKSERARERGSIFQRLALGTAIQMPWLHGKPEAGSYGIVHPDCTGIEQVPRYLHYEKAYLDGELDPAFKDMNTWECRFITNSEYSNEDLEWTRRMMRNYRPDHITMEDYKWRYVRFIKSDVPYCSTTHDPSLGTQPQMEVALGGVCGRRAFLGRLTTREFESDYQLVLRAQWLGDACNEEDVSIKHGNYGKGGGFWDGLAFVKKQLIVRKAEVAALELVGGMKLGESDELLGDEKGKDIEIPDEFKTTTTAADGTITLPAVACYSPRNSSDRILFLKSWEEGYQLHYSRLGQQPELFKYRVEIPADGEYELTAEVATVSPNLEVLVRVNRDEPGPFAMPFTKGMWQTSAPIRVKLTQGRNTLSVTARTPNRGISIKRWNLKPVK